jgi:NAD(P)H dehydrogenase (quinone)
LILVSGAAGKTGRAVIRALAARVAAVRAMVRRPEQIASVRELGAQDALAGDMRDPATWIAALAGTDAVYHICPNMAPDEVAIGRLALEVAQSSGTVHFAYHSVLHPQTETMRHHWNKLRVEELIFESGLSFPILPPAAYMQNLLASWDTITAEGYYRVPYAVETRLGMVDLEDVAAAAAIVLTQPGHEGATYELCGPEVLTQIDVAGVLAQQLGRPVRAETIPLEAWEQQARTAGLGNYQVQALTDMFRYYERYGFEGNSHVLSWLLGRPPTSLATFAAAVKQ